MSKIDWVENWESWDGDTAKLYVFVDGSAMVFDELTCKEYHYRHYEMAQAKLERAGYR